MNTNEILKSEQYKGYTIEFVREMNAASWACRMNMQCNFDGFRFAATRHALEEMDAFSDGRYKGFVEDMDEVLDQLVDRYLGDYEFGDSIEKILAINSTGKAMVIPFQYDGYEYNAIYNESIVSEIKYLHIDSTRINMIAVFEHGDLDFRDYLYDCDIRTNWVEIGTELVQNMVYALQAILRGEIYTCRIKNGAGVVISETEGILHIIEDDYCDLTELDLTTDGYVDMYAKPEIDKLVAAKEKEVLA